MHYDLVPGLNYSFRPSAAPQGTTPESHFERGLYAYVNADKSPELKRQSDSVFGKTVPFSGSIDNAMLVGRALMSHTGYRQDPLRYMKEKKMPIPPNWSGENHELYTLIGQDFIKRSQEEYNNSAAARKAVRDKLEENTQTLRSNLTDLLQNHPGVIENAILKAEDITDFNSWSEISSRVPQMDKRQLATSMQKASYAYNLIKDDNRTHISRRDMAYLLNFLGDWKTVNGERVYEQDELATTFFQAALASKSQRAAKDAGFFDSAINGLMTAPRGVAQLLDEGLKIYDWFQSDDSQLGKDAITLRDSDRYRHLMAGIQNTINQANAATTTPGKDASLWQKIKVGLGSSTGETIHFFSGALGAANFLVGRTNLERINAEVNGAANPWLEGAVKTGAQFAAEKIAFGAVNKFAVSSRVADWAIKKFGISKVTPAFLSKIQANAIGRGVLNVGAGTLEELALEPAMEQLYNGGVRGCIRTLGVNVEQYTYKDEEGRPVTNNPIMGAILSIWDSITDPATVISTGIFVVSLTAGQKAEIYRQSALITKDVEKLVGMGIKQEEAEDIAKDPSAKSRQNRVQQAIIRDLSLDPKGLKQRVETAQQERLSRLEAEIQARSGVLAFGLKQAGILKQSPTKDGNFLVTVPKTEQELAAEREGKDPEAAAAIPSEKEVEMSADELTAFATTITENETLAHLRDLQSRVMGAAALISSKSESDVQKDIVYAADLQSRAVSIMLRKGNIIDAEVIQAFVDEAANTISGFRKQGMTQEQAEAQPSVVPGVSLGAMANLHKDFTQRVKDEGGNPADFQTNIFNMPSTTPGHSVILMVKGEVTAEQALEDLIENDIRHAIETQEGLLENLASALKAVDAEMAELDPEYEPLLTSDTPDYQKVVEAFSHLAAADFALNHGMLPLSEMAHAAIDYSLTKLSDLQKLQNIVNAYNAAKAAGRLEDTPLEHFLDKARVDMGDVFSAPFEQGMQQALNDVAEAESLRDQYAEGNIPTPQPYTHTPAADSITGEPLLTPIQEQPDPVDQQTGQYTAPDAAYTAQDAQAGKGLANETCTQEDDGSVRGAAPTASLTPHPDAAPLRATDAWNPASAPVHLARRGDGSLLIVSGQPASTTYTPAQVYDVDPATETYWVASHSAAQNILNRTATAQDIQTFFDLNPMTRAQAEAAGMVIKDSQGRPHPQYKTTFALTPLTPEARKSFSVARRSQQFHSILVTAKREASRYSSTYRNASHNAKQAIVESARLSGILQGIAKRIPTAFRPKGLTERIRIHNTLARMLHDGKLSRSSKLNKAFMEALREELSNTGETANAEIEARLRQALSNPADPVRKKVEERLRKELYSKVARQHLDAINKLSTDPSLAPKKRAYERMAESGFIPESMLEEVYEAILDTVAEEAQQKDPENKLTKAGRRKLENELLRKHAKAYAKAQLRDIAFLSEMEKRYRTEEKQNLIHGFARVQADGRIAADSTLPPAAQSSLAHAVEEELAAALPEAIAKELNTTLPEINKELMQEIMSRHIGQELHTVLTGIVDEVADSIDRAYKAHYLGRLQRALDTLKPNKSKSHLAPGKLSHEQYAYIAKLVEYTRLTLPQLEEKQTALQARITELGEKEGESEALMEAQIQYAELTTFGALLQRSADDVVNAVEKFFDIISTGKAEWREKLEAQAARIRSAQNAIKAGVGKVDKDALAEKERQAASFLGSLKLGLSLKNFFSIPQFLDWLTLIPGMKGMAQSWRTAHARAVQVIRRLELDDIAAEKAFWKSIGVETDLQQAAFFESALKRTSTGIYTANKVERRTLKIDNKTALEWLNLSEEQREERRNKLRAEGAKPETIVEEEAIPAIVDLLDSSKEKIRISYKHELQGTSYELKADKMILLNLVLMAERPAFTEHMAEVGFDRATIARIKRYLGKDIRAYGDFMRKYIQRTGMREVYAERTGIKIPDDDFYWPGNFDQSNRLDDAASALEQSLALQGRYGFLKELKEHNLDPTLIMGAHQVFRTALSQHRHYIHLGQLSQDLRRLVHDKDTAAALKTYMGIAGFNSFKAHLDTLDGMPAAQTNVTRWLNRIVGVALAARATILLPANIGTLIKNLSSVINASRGSNMTLAQELKQILIDRVTPEDKLGISIKELWNSDIIQTRFRNISHYEAIRSLGSNGKFSKASIITRGLFRGIEAFDAAGNVLGAQALYNFTYQQEKKANATREANGEQPLTEKEIHQVCKQTVQIMLDIAAQPLSPTQSSALAARDRSALTRSLVFMGSEGINKLANAELAAIHKGADAGFISRLLARAQYLAPYSTFEQMVVMAIALAAGNAPSDDDEEWKWWVGNAIAAATGAGVLQSYPLIGDTLSELTRAITGSKNFMPTGMMAELTGTDLSSLIKIGKDTAVITKAITDSITETPDKKNKSAAELTWIILQDLRRIATIAAPFGGYSRIGTTISDTLTATNAIGNLCRYPAQAWKNAEAAEKKAKKRASTRRKGTSNKRKGTSVKRKAENNAQ